MDDDATGQDTPTEGEQPQELAQEEQSETTDQGLIAKYLEGVDPEIRSIVAERLENQRKDSDRLANKKIADLSTQVKSYEQVTGSVDTAKFLGTLYQGLVTQPVETMQWIIDEYKQDNGRDLWQELMAVMQPEPTPDDSKQAEATPTPAASDKDLKADLEAYVQEQLAKVSQEIEEKRVSAGELEQARQRANGWLTDSASKHKIPLDEGDRHYILQQASALIDSGTVTSGQEAIDLATENLSKRLKDLSRKRPADESVRVAKGGNGTSPAAPDLRSPKARREAALAILQHERE